MYKQALGFVYLGNNVNHNTKLSMEIDWRISNAWWSSFRKYTLELDDQPSAPLELKIQILKAEVVKIILFSSIT